MFGGSKTIVGLDIGSSCIKAVELKRGRGGAVELAPTGQIERLILNQANRLAHHCLAALQALVTIDHLVIILGET